jgi:hypothetical protein
MFEIINQGQAIRSTTYWDTDPARAGYFYLSWNANAARLLVPDLQQPLLREMQGAREVIVSRGPWPEQGGREGIELLWEDNSDDPFSIHLVAEQCDRLIPETDQGGGFVVVAWTRQGEQGRWPGRYRWVPQIPWLQAWASH